MKPICLALLALVFNLCAVVAAENPPDTKPAGVQITQLTNRLHIEINGKLFAEYLFKDVPRPCYWPVVGPGDAVITRSWPLKDVPDEEHDHPHHRGLWFAHSSVNGQDTWTEHTGTIVHTDFDEIKSGKDVGIIRSRNQWVGKNGAILCTDERTFRVYNRPDHERLFDFEVTVHASHGELTFGDNKDGLMAVRLAESMRLKPNKFNTGKPTGHIVNSEGIRDADTWGKQASWVDYAGPVDGKIVGVAIFDHPQNPRHPTWWHVRDYGLFGANPFGRHEFEKLKDVNAGNLVVPAGKSVTFRYRFFIHEGDEQQSKVAEHYAEYIK